MNYLILEGETQGNFCILLKIEGFDDDYKLSRGDSLINEWPDNVIFRMDPDYKNKIRFSDNILNVDNVLIVSKRLREFLENEKVPNVEFLKVTVLNHKKKAAPGEYFIANLVATQDCIDIKKSGVKWNHINSNYIDSVKRLVLDESRIDTDVALFRAKHLRELIFIRKDLAKKIEKAKFTGIHLWEVSDYGTGIGDES